MTTNTTREPAIRVRGIQKSFKDLQVLRGVDFDVTAGSIFALLGSNGAGKTTLVRILSTLFEGRRGHRDGERSRRRREAGPGAGGDQSDRAVRRGR